MLQKIKKSLKESVTGLSVWELLLLPFRAQPQLCAAAVVGFGSMLWHGNLVVSILITAFCFGLLGSRPNDLLTDADKERHMRPRRKRK